MNLFTCFLRDVDNGKQLVRGHVTTIPKKQEFKVASTSNGRCSASNNKTNNGEWMKNAAGKSVQVLWSWQPSVNKAINWSQTLAYFVLFPVYHCEDTIHIDRPARKMSRAGNINYPTSYIQKYILALILGGQYCPVKTLSISFFLFKLWTLNSPSTNNLCSVGLFVSKALSRTRNIF